MSNLNDVLSLYYLFYYCNNCQYSGSKSLTLIHKQTVGRIRCARGPAPGSDRCKHTFDWLPNNFVQSFDLSFRLALYLFSFSTKYDSSSNFSSDMTWQLSYLEKMDNMVNFFYEQFSFCKNEPKNWPINQMLNEVFLLFTNKTWKLP